MTVTVTPEPLSGSVFSPTRMRGVVERFHSSSLRGDAPPCEYVEADFDGLKVAVEDLGHGDRGEMRRQCTVLVGGILSEFGDLEQDGSVQDGSSFGSRTVDPRTIERIRVWSVGHGMPDLGPARSPRKAA